MSHPVAVECCAEYTNSCRIGVVVGCGGGGNGNSSGGGGGNDNGSSGNGNNNNGGNGSNNNGNGGNGNSNDDVVVSNEDVSEGDSEYDPIEDFDIVTVCIKCLKKKASKKSEKQVFEILVFALVLFFIIFRARLT